MNTIRMIAAAVLITAGGAALAQTSGITRHEALRHDLGTTGKEAVQVRVDFAPGTSFPFHSHPGEEIAYVLEGEVQYQLEGQQPVTLKTGEALYIPAGVNHSASNHGKTKASELATYLVEKGKPIVVLKK